MPSAEEKSVKIKAKITEIMPSAIKEKCPYCMLSEPGTFDHYIGKGEFPEFSILSKNLVPCCSKCNSKKGEKFLSENGKRIFISFYFDVGEVNFKISYKFL